MPDGSEFKPYPTVNYWYRIKKGDFLNIIAGKAYGDRKRWPVIWNANQTQLKSGDPDNPAIGETVFIPELPERRKLERKTKEELTGKAMNELTLIIEGHEVKPISASFTSTIDTMSDGWTALLSWIPGLDPEFDRITKKKSYSNTELYLGGKLQASGKLYDVDQSLTNEGYEKELQFYSHNFELVRSTAMPPYQKSNISLLQRCQEFAAIYGLNVEVDKNLDDKFENDINSIFHRVTIQPTEKIFDHLKKLAEQRGILLTSTRHGDILLTRAAINGKIIDTIKEGQYPFPETFTASFKGSQMYANYRLIGQSPGNRKLVGTVKDETIRGSSHITMNSNDTNSASIKDAAIYAKNKAIADSYEQDLPLASWYSPKGELLKRNGLYNIESSVLDAPDGFIFLNRRTNFSFDATGMSASISIVPPSVYSKGDLVEAGQ